MSLTIRSSSAKILKNKRLPRLKGNFRKIKVSAVLYVDNTKKNNEDAPDDLEHMLFHKIRETVCNAYKISSQQVVSSMYDVHRTSTKYAPPPELIGEVELEIGNILRDESPQKWYNIDRLIEIYKKAKELGKI